MCGEVADDHGELELENDELSGGPHLGPSPQPLDLIPDHAVDEEHQEDGINDQGALHHPHGDSVDVLEGGGLAGVVGWGGEGASDEERK